MGGTTEEMMMPRTSAASTLPIAKRLRKSTPYSSTVWVLMVATRQCASSRGAEFLPEIPGMFISYTPSTVLVLPTSRTNSIRSPQQRPHAAGYDDPQTFVGADAEKATRIQAVGHAAETAVLIHVYQLTVCVGRTRLHALDDRLKTEIRSSHRAGDGAHQGAIFAIESPHQRTHQLRTRPLLARLNTQRSGRAAEICRHFAVVDVDADANHRVLHACGFRAHLREDAGEFLFVQQQVIGPADIRPQTGNLPHCLLDGDSRDQGQPQRVSRRHGRPQKK